GTPRVRLVARAGARNGRTDRSGRRGAGCRALRRMAFPVREALIGRRMSGNLRACSRSALCRLLVSAPLLIGLARSSCAQTTPDAEAASSAIAGNPGAVNIVAGTGELGRLIGLGPESGLRLGGVLVSNGNYLVARR